ncbi:hypothetical protein [Actinoplanes sp. HUAS TT8]|uniref:hypothetical protein n=1 Tax=Actinoplanes sp. HUAS TT8 TaxID=3447453 RepID=UPI003F51E93F
MSWLQWLLLVGAVIFVGWGAVFWILERRAGAHKQHFSDGCAKPFFEQATRSDGSRKNIIPRPGDGDIEDLEHLLEHKRRAEEV